MDAAGRKAFWDILCSLKAYDHESAQKLIKAAPFPHELCRFRAVNEHSLLQLQNNEQFFSTADYYDDPFDTYFSIRFQELQESCEDVKKMLDRNCVEPIRNELSKVGLNAYADAIIQALKASVFDMDWLKISLKNVRNFVQKQIHSICFCEDSLNEAMWLKYADQHKGFVQVYDFNNHETKLCGNKPECTSCRIMKTPPITLPVYYSSEMYDATAFALALMYRETLKDQQVQLPQSLIDFYLHTIAWESEKISLIKKECHQYDQEWRMLLPTQYTDRPSIMLKPKSVLIGLRTPEYHKRLIISAARIAGIQEIYQVFINEKNLLDKKQLIEE